MKITHVAIWTNDLECLKNFYVKYFEGKSNQKYFNKTTQFKSYFISFGSGCRLELMSQPDLVENTHNSFNYKGIAHFAFEVETQREVDLKAQELKTAGFPILRGPRTTGDGYYEVETLDPDGNKIEITTTSSNSE